MGYFLPATAYRLTVGPTQPPIQWILGVLSPGVKRPGREVYHSAHIVLRLSVRGAIRPLLHYVYMA